MALCYNTKYYSAHKYNVWKTMKPQLQRLLSYTYISEGAQICKGWPCRLPHLPLSVYTAGLLCLQGLSDNLLWAHQVPDILWGVQPLPGDLHARQSLPVNLCWVSGLQIHTLLLLGYGSQGFRPLTYRISGFPTLSYGSRFCPPTYFGH